ncbi:MAG: 50S ribosomal protein L21 [Candidatus Obscuribacterales bacterium]|nr:50S ribosomal protein L21 [Candidatus Obscuribacterales bacterium]
MYAIVEACGRQYQLEAGRFIDVEMLALEPGDNYTFDKVLMIVDSKGSHVGEPYVSGAKVKGRVISHGRDKKIIVYHMRPKKGTRKKQGHRQGHTRVIIDSIELNDKVLAESKDTGKKAPVKKAEAKEAKAPKKEAKKESGKAPAKAEKPAAKKAAKSKAE